MKVTRKIEDFEDHLISVENCKNLSEILDAISILEKVLSTIQKCTQFGIELSLDSNSNNIVCIFTWDNVIRIRTHLVILTNNQIDKAKTFENIQNKIQEYRDLLSQLNNVSSIEFTKEEWNNISQATQQYLIKADYVIQVD